MARLAVYLLGPPRIERDSVAISLDRRKALALLAFLAVTGQSHRRDSLVNLLWPDYDTTRGRAALRRTLHALKTALGGDWLDIDREEIGLTPGTAPSTPPGQAPWVDVVEFRRRLTDCATHGHPAAQVCPACLAPLTEAVALAHGEFLGGFGLKDSDNFDDWQLFETEALRRELAGALDTLVRWHSAQREFEPALGYARRRLNLDPFDEPTHRQMMRLYAWSGRRSAALRQYDECVAVLRDQLGVPPQEATTQLHGEIQSGCAPPLPTALDSAAEAPSFLKEDQPAERPVFVARERELAQLEGFLDQALAGQGRVAFVTGEAGSGKTALIQEFAWCAQAAHPDLVVAGGHGNAHTGAGDPYLPFRELLSLLAGDVEAPGPAGAITREQAGRLRRLLPLAVQALVRMGPDLIDLFVPGPPLLERARTVRPWPVASAAISRLEELVARGLDSAGAFRVQQSALFEQYTQVLRALATSHPLLLTLDDLQWADGGSVNLLFHLGRRLAGSRILVIGAYRPAEVALGRPTSVAPMGAAEAGSSAPREHESPAPGRHPLEPVVNELKRTFADVEVDLERAEGRSFVDAFLDSEPNCLGEAFREALHERTLGHPLFTVDLLRGMRERADLVHDQQGRWVEGSVLDWETLPARVEAVIAERLGRLPQSLRDLLSVACVEGETFTAQVAAQVQATGEQYVLRSLSETLDRKHRLVSARGMVRAGSQRLFQYRFRHILYQRYLYSTLDEVQRVYLHEQVGTSLERLYAEQESAVVAVQLARHFQEAGNTEKAIHYLRQAGVRAVQLSAYEEGCAHLSRALTLLMTQPDSSERDQRELDLQLDLGVALRGSMGTQSSEMKGAYIRARELCLNTGKTSQLCQVLGELALHHYTRGEHQIAREFAEQALETAQRLNDLFLEALSHWYLGVVSFCLGEYATAQAHLAQVIAFYVPQQHHRALLLLRGSDAGVSALAYTACTLWSLGYLDQALQRSREALALARELNHPFSLADVLCYGGCLFSRMCRDPQALKSYAEELVRLTREKVPVWVGMGELYLGGALALLGLVQEGLAQLHEGIAVVQSRNVRVGLSSHFALLAEAQARAGRPEEGLATVAEALAFVEQTHEHHSEAELARLRAELLLMQGDEAEAEACLHKAIEVARRQKARAWELRAATSLARLWRAQGRIDEARRMLAEIYGWFTEGFDTPDLKEAKALLEELV